MATTETQSGEDIRQLLVRCWMTHDAMWFAAALRDSGTETANRLNLAAIRGLAPIEVKRIRQALGIEEVSNTDQVRAFVEGTFALVGGDFMAFDWTWRDDGTARVDTRHCFAHDGIAKLGVVADYQCGIFERIYAWLDALGVDYDADPSERHCLLHHQGRCWREFRFNFG
ncbi:MAG: DUF6125 family protein [Alphaproteobacteria bacterium]|nr:DUF6125 family protein [Alphaproteobacteria bacterium]